MQISISNAIESLRRGGARIIQFGLQLWLDFNKSEVIGSEEAVNGDFALNSDWSEGVGWDVAGNGFATCDGLQTGVSNLSQVIYTVGKAYKTIINVNSVTAGSISIFTGTSSSQLNITAANTYTITQTSASDTLYIQADASFIGSISNVSVKEVTQFVMDKSPNTNNAKLFTGKALSFDGANSVDVGGFTSVGGELTMAVWVFINEVSTNKVIMEKISPNRFIFRINGSTVEVYDGSVRTFGSIDANKYQRLSLTVTSSEMKCYVNNVQLGATITNHNAIDLSSISNCRIGSDQLGTAQFFDGNLSDFQIYNKAWTASDVAFDYNNPNHLAIDNPDTDLVVTDLKAYWALSEGDGLVAYDSSGEGNNGTINGATYVTAQPTIPQLGMMDWAKGSNMVSDSQDFTTLEWKNEAVAITSGQAIAPDGSMTANKSIPSTTNARHISYQSETYSAGIYTFSVFVKKLDYRYAFIQAAANGAATRYGVILDLDTGLVTDTNVLGSPTDTNYVIEIKANGWYRVILTINHTLGNILYPVFGASDSAVPTYNAGKEPFFAGNGTDGIYFWGAQIESGTTASAYRTTDSTGAAIDVTTIQNPNNKGYDILGNALRLREHSFNLDGSGYAEVADDATLDFGTGDFSIECWAKFDFENNGSSWNSIVSLGESIVSTISAGLATKVGKFYFNIGGTTTVSSTTALVVGNWYHVVGTRTGTTMRLYINTAVESITATSAQTVTNTGSKIIGDDAATDKRAYQNLIDDPRLYNRPLTQKEITNNYNIGLKTHAVSSSYSDDYSSDYGF
jgi:hypothetical protein